MKKSTTFLVLSSLIIIIFVLIFKIQLVNIFESLSEYFYPKKAEGKAEFLKIILSVLGALGILWGIVISLRRAKALEMGVFNQTKQLELTSKSQIDERFKNAIEHLGSDKEPVILGGIAELYQIAKESKKDYREVVFNILCSYVRSEANYKNENILFTPIQTIFDYLFKKNQDDILLFAELNADLKKTDLKSVNMDNSILRNANLTHCYFPNLKNVDLSYSNLTEANFKIVDMHDVIFKHSKIYKAFFGICQMSNCSFSNIEDFTNNNFFLCKLSNSVFEKSSFFNNKYIACDLKDIKFSNSSIINSSFALSNLKDVDFSNAKLFGNVDFRATNFQNVNFYKYTTESNFTGANMDERYSAILYEENLEKCSNRKIDERIKSFVDFHSDFKYKSKIEIFSEKDRTELNDIINEIKDIDKEYYKKNKHQLNKRT